MDVILAILYIVWSILGIILFFKTWRMTNNVKEIRDWMMEDRLKKQSLNNEGYRSFSLNSEKGLEDLPRETIQKKSFSVNLKKGDKIKIAEFGICTFEGVWGGKYAFYPENINDLPDSPYLVNDVEPYLLIPSNKLGSLIG